MSEPTSAGVPRMQFLWDSAGYLMRQANIAAFPYWEGVELDFDTELVSDRSGVLLIARLRKGKRWVGERFFTLEELRDNALLPGVVEAWVEALDVPG